MYDEVPTKERPRILGLTASLLNSKVKYDNLEKHIQDLEKSMRSCVRTASDHGQVIDSISKNSRFASLRTALSNYGQTLVFFF